MNGKRVLSGLLTLTAGLLVAACTSGQKPSGGSPSLVEGVKVETVQLQETPEVYEAVGTIRSATSSVLAAQISGTVREIRVKTGDRVQRGELLALLDDRSPRAQLGVAEAGVEESAQGMAEVEQALQAAAADRTFAEVTYRRYQDLLAKNSVSRQEFDGAEARYKAAVAQEAALAAKRKQMQARQQQAKSQQESAQALLSYSRIVSPINGLVTAKSVDAGTVVMPGMPILTVEDTVHYRLEASLPEQFLTKVQVGRTVRVTTDGGDFEGRVVEIVPAADAGSRTVVVKVELPGNCGCRSGGYGKARFPVGEQRCLTVPRSSLVEKGQLEGVFVVNAQGVVEYRLIKSGKNLGDRMEVLSGLAEGERVATSRTDRLSDGVRVEEGGVPPVSGHGQDGRAADRVEIR
jgi:multidrug efflux pump subunit AcrA (membrane-fusion protein)